MREPRREGSNGDHSYAAMHWRTLRSDSAKLPANDTICETRVLDELAHFAAVLLRQCGSCSENTIFLCACRDPT